MREKSAAIADVKGTEAEKANGKTSSGGGGSISEEGGGGGAKKERSVLQAKLTRLAIQSGYAGEDESTRISMWELGKER